MMIYAVMQSYWINIKVNNKNFQVLKLKFIWRDKNGAGSWKHRIIYKIIPALHTILSLVSDSIVSNAGIIL